MFNNSLKSIVISVIFSFSTFAYAESYIGFGFGNTDYDGEQVAELTLSLNNAVPTSSSAQMSDSGAKFYYGYQFTPVLAFELFYADLGEFVSNASGPRTISVPPLFTSTSILNIQVASELSSVGLAAVYQFNEEGVYKPFIKLGLHDWDLDFVVNFIEGSSQIASISEKTSGTDVFYGLGIDVSVSDTFSLAFEYEYFRVNENILDNVSILSAGLRFNF